MFKKILLSVMVVMLITPLSSAGATFDQSVTRALFQVRIHDTYLGTDISWGTGVSFGLGEILTNYHVAQKVLENPKRYQAYACETVSLDERPNCKYLLSTVLFGWGTGEPKYDKDRDLALLYIDKVLINKVWQTAIALPIDEWSGNPTVEISDYLNKYDDLKVNDTVYAIGYPDYSDGKTTLVSGKVLRYESDYRSGQPLIVSDFKISHGNSGGPVFNDRGQFIGIVVQCYHNSAGKCFEGLFIPLTTINWWYSDSTEQELILWEGRRIYMAKNGLLGIDFFKQWSCSNAPNAHYDASVATDRCTCNDGYQRDVTSGLCTQNATQIDRCSRLSAIGYTRNSRGECVTGNQYCAEILGPNSHITRIDLFDWQCVCNDTYQIDSTTQQCITKQTQPNIDIAPGSSVIDTKLISRLKGKILLQVEAHGEAWYLDPASLKRYYLKNGEVAYEALRRFGLGITTTDLEKIPSENSSAIGNQSLVNRLRGRILLQVQQNGEAWYLNPKDSKRYYLKNGEEAYRIMRVLSLGISDADLSKIPVGDL